MAHHILSENAYVFRHFSCFGFKKVLKEPRDAVFAVRKYGDATGGGDSLHFPQLIAIFARNLCCRSIRMPGIAPLSGVVRLIARRML